MKNWRKIRAVKGVVYLKRIGRVISLSSFIFFILVFFTLANRSFTENAVLNRVADLVAVLCLIAFVVGVFLMTAGRSASQDHHDSRSETGQEDLPAESATERKRGVAASSGFRRFKILLAVIIFIWLFLAFPYLALSRVGVFDRSSFSDLGNAVGSIVIGAFVIIPQYVLPPLGLLVIPLFICGLYLLFSKRRRPVLDVLVVTMAILSFASLFYLNLKMDVGPNRQEKQPPEKAVNLSFPLRDGKYLVVQSGRGLNLHTEESEKYALDIKRSGNWSSLFGLGKNSDPAVDITFGTPVYSPCYGNIKKLERDRPDLPIGSKDMINEKGNYVVIAGDHFDVLLAHLRCDSIAVGEGDVVQVGQYIGMIGNSGNTDGPHLHIMAYRGDGENRAAIPLPMVFEGRYLGLGDSWP